MPIACVVALELGASGNELLGGLNCRLPRPSHTGPRAGFSHQGAQPSGGCAGRCPGRAGHPIARRQKGRRNRYYVSGTLNTQAGTDRAQGWRLPPEEIEDAVIRVLADALICRGGGTGAVSKSVVVLTRNRGFAAKRCLTFHRMSGFNRLRFGANASVSRLVNARPGFPEILPTEPRHCAAAQTIPRTACRTRPHSLLNLCSLAFCSNCLRTGAPQAAAHHLAGAATFLNF